MLNIEEITNSSFEAAYKVIKQTSSDAIFDSNFFKTELKKLVRKSIAQNPENHAAEASILAKSIGELIAAQYGKTDAAAATCCVFLGAGVHFGPPTPANQERLLPAGAHIYNPLEHPPVGNALAGWLDEQCGFTHSFPNENSGDWQRVATWMESKMGRTGDVLGLESRIRTAVEEGKKGTEILKIIANWPCSYFYTTNYDTHLEKCLLAKHEKLWVWIYNPAEKDLRQSWYEVTLGNPLPVKWNPADEMIDTGVPAQPPADRPHVFKLHGDVNISGSIVITDNDYTAFMRCIADRRSLPDRLLLPLRNAVLFIGYSLKDYNMRYLLSMLRDGMNSTNSNVLATYSASTSFSVDLRPDPIIKAVWQEKKGWVTFLEDNLWYVVPKIDAAVTASLAKLQMPLKR